MRLIDEYIREAFRLRDDTVIDTSYTLNDIIRKHFDVMLHDKNDLRRVQDLEPINVYDFCQKVFNSVYEGRDERRLHDFASRMLNDCDVIYTRMFMGGTTFYERHAEPFFDELRRKKIEPDYLLYRDKTMMSKGHTIEIIAYETDEFMLQIAGGREGMACEILIGIKK